MYAVYQNLQVFGNTYLKSVYIKVAGLFEFQYYYPSVCKQCGFSWLHSPTSPCLSLVLVLAMEQLFLNMYQFCR